MKGKAMIRKTTAFMLVLVFSLVFAQMIPDNGITPVIQAKSIKKTIKKAEKAYMKNINALGEECGSPVEYKFVDITGDKVPEALAKYTKQNKRHGNLDVYTYKKGKRTKNGWYHWMFVYASAVSLKQCFGKWVWPYGLCHCYYHF